MALEVKPESDWLPLPDTEHCLICLSPNLQRPSFTECEFANNNDNNQKPILVYKELNVIYVLRNILEIPGETLEKYLVKLGSPSEWRVRLCGKCDDAVTNANRIYQEILDATAIYKAVKNEIIEAIKRSNNEVDQSANRRRRRSGSGNIRYECLSGISGLVSSESRDFVLNHDYGPSADPFLLGDLKAAEKIVDIKMEDNLTPSPSEPQSESEPDEVNHLELDSWNEDDFVENSQFLRNYPANEMSVNSDSSDSMDIENSPLPPSVDQLSVENDFNAVVAKEEATKSTKRKSKLRHKAPKKPILPKREEVRFDNDPSIPHGYTKNRKSGYFCKCGKVYKNFNHLKRHIKISLQLTPTIYCEICKNADPSVLIYFKRPDALQRHIEGIHEGTQAVCQYCGENYRRAYYWNHVRRKKCYIPSKRNVKKK